ncbi:MAG: DNA-binding protein [Cytophaga sp.]|nr:DNA-binding protein [Cytophaga sp.]
MINRDQLLTIGDLHDFRTLLLSDITEILKAHKSSSSQQWLRSSEVIKMLHVSPGTLQNMRLNGSLRFSKVGGIVYYKYDDVVKMLEGNSNRGDE